MQPIKIILSIALFAICSACGSEFDTELHTEHNVMDAAEEMTLDAPTKAPKRLTPPDECPEEAHRCSDPMCTGYSEKCSEKYGKKMHFGHGGRCLIPETHLPPD